MCAYKDINDALRSEAIVERYELLLSLHCADQDRQEKGHEPLGKDLVRYLFRGA